MLIVIKSQFSLTKKLRAVCLFAALLALLTSPILAQAPGAAATTPDTSPATQPRTFINYFLSTPPQGELVRETWGATNVLPRDIRNGLEDTTMKRYCYWDGQIIKAPDGKYHLFASRWSQSRGHGGWFGSVAVHAVSDSLFGPYVDNGLCWPNDAGGRGHNVTALTLPDGRYAVVISETRPCEVYVSKSLDGPWEHLGTITVEGDPRWHASNVSIMARSDGNFEFVPRDGRIFFSDTGILGPYKPQGDSVFPKGIPNLEDPCIWYSGGLYHIVVNSWSTRKAYHLSEHLTGLRDLCVGTLTRPQAKMADFYRELGHLFGVALSPNNRWHSAKSLREKWLAHIEAAAYRPVLIIDEAQEMNPLVVSELRLLASADLDSRSILTIILAGDQRLAARLEEPDWLPIASRIRSRLRLEALPPKALQECLNHLLKTAGNPKLLSTSLVQTLCEHAAGNLRLLMNMANDLLAAACQQERDVIDEKLYFEVFALDPKPAKKS